MIEWLQERLNAPIPTWMAVVPVALIALAAFMDHLFRHRRKRKPKRNPELLMVRDGYVTTLDHLYDIKAISWTTRDRQLRELQQRGYDVKRHLMPHPEMLHQHLTNVKAFIKTRRNTAPKEKPIKFPDGKLIVHN